MKGILFNLIEEAFSEEFGSLMWDTLLDDTRIAHGYTALGNYPDDEAMALVDSAAVRMGMDRRDTLVWIGKRSTKSFYSRCPEYFHGHRDSQSFLITLNEIIHPDVRKLDAHAHPPSFECTRLSENRMKIVYDSQRPMCGLAEGLITGVAHHFGESVDVHHPTCELRGDKACVFQTCFRRDDLT